MSGVVFDPDAHAEFLAAVEYYEKCQSGLGLRFRKVVEREIGGIAAMHLEEERRIHFLRIFKP